ncbi:helix-turn-helix domain-containing protein [Sinorhizobium meliloti]|uniref:helix-turn-helix domain-containing protein n=1 Tax=Rhizobium meliloti TaxID=382 RepID=UPI00299DA61F|nr:helix-turn-helix domain-containing protein [Sinorhizobium meliloti]
MTTIEAAAYIGKSASWLNKTRMSGTGPVYLKIGGGVRYDMTDLDAFLAGKRRTAIYDFANDNTRAALSAA